MKYLLQNLTNPRVLFAMLYDLFAAGASFWVSIYLRYEISNFDLRTLPDIKILFLINISVLLFSFLFSGLYKGVWRYCSIFDLIRVFKASLFGLLSAFIITYYIIGIQGLPRSVYFIQFFVLIVSLGGGRFLYRYFKDFSSFQHLFSHDDTIKKNVLIIGAGRAGEKLLRDIMSTPKMNLNVIGFVDDDLRKINSLIHNKKVLGTTSQIPKIMINQHFEKIFIAIPSASNIEIKRILSYFKKDSVEIKILPKLDQLLSKEVGISLLRNINIEDLLGREQVELETENLIDMLSEEVVLVTGAGGSIGSELCTQILKYNPKVLILVDYCELFMYELEQKLLIPGCKTKLIFKILDIRDESTVSSLFSTYNPQVIFHAAAYKHVPMMEKNPRQAINTNVIGTRIVAEASFNFKAKKFIMVSTDKAVNPTNIMGASKRIAEMIITELSIKSDFTKFISVRFGNVLGSNGSVIPYFKKLIDERTDLPITHPDMTRFFMSIPEASQLVLQAGAMGNGGEIFVLDMGNPVKIVDLAKEMIKLAGLELGKDINLIFTGLRPGEKMYEELFSEGESCSFTANKKINISHHRSLNDDFNKNLEKLTSSKSEDKLDILHLIQNLVPEMNHEDTK